MVAPEWMSSQSRGISHLKEVLPLNALQEAMENFIDHYGNMEGCLVAEKEDCASTKGSESTQGLAMVLVAIR